MTSVEILKEEFEKAGLVVAEEAAMKALEALKSTMARIALEGEEASLKTIAPIATIVLTAIEPQLLKLIDFNKNGVVGK